MEVNTSIAVLILLTSIIAYFVKGLVGFGPSLILVPVLSFFLDFHTSVVIATLADITSSSVLFIKNKKQVHFKQITSIIIGLLFGTLIGVSLFNIIPVTILKKLFGLLLILFVIKNFLKNKLEEKKYPKFMAFPFGILGGILGGLFNTNGPPIVIYLKNTLNDKKAIRANLSAIFAVDAFWRGVLFYTKGNINLMSIWIYVFFVLPGLIIGLYSGNWLIKKLNNKSITSIIEAILFTVGFGLIIK